MPKASCSTKHDFKINYLHNLIITEFQSEETCFIVQGHEHL